MKDKKDKSDLTPGHEQELFSNLEFSYSRSKADVWGSLEGMLGDEPEAKPEKEQVNAKPEITPVEDGAEIVEFMVEKPAKRSRVISINRTFISIAASVVLIISAGLFARFYTTTIQVAAGEFTSHTLPDGSEVHLNAATTITYHPYWWRMDRSVSLEGEAYFVVAKGEKFTVTAPLGTTQVLGTEFNVYARDDVFKVFCEEGVVRVVSDKVVAGRKSQATLTAGSLAVLEDGEFSNEEKSLVTYTEETVARRNENLAWRSGQFIYNTTPLSKVLDDFRRHYGVTIKLSDEILDDSNVTATFDRVIPFDESMEIVLSTSEIPGLMYEKDGEGIYVIKTK